MSTQTIALKLTPQTYEQFQGLYQALQQDSKQPQAKVLGDNLANIACEIIDQVFGALVRNSTNPDKDSQKVLQQVLDTVKKYLPWSVSFFGNDRLLPMVSHVEKSIFKEGEQGYISYQVDKNLIDQLLANVDKMKQGDNQAVRPALKYFTEIVDQGVTALIREPKQKLKFNMVVDKTLNGVINVTTQLAYKRFDKLITMHEASSMSGFIDHFLVFLKTDKAG